MWGQAWRRRLVPGGGAIDHRARWGWAHAVKNCTGCANTAAEPRTVERGCEPQASQTRSSRNKYLEQASIRTTDLLDRDGSVLREGGQAFAKQRDIALANFG